MDYSVPFNEPQRVLELGNVLYHSIQGATFCSTAAVSLGLGQHYEFPLYPLLKISNF